MYTRFTQGNPVAPVYENYSVSAPELKHAGLGRVNRFLLKQTKLVCLTNFDIENILNRL